ncbi:MAG: radical SAM protein [Candidatus Omnitrophica bacterium]|nr:radical SAM protein [Candidatus Omnitrophota bacterium]
MRLSGKITAINALLKARVFNKKTPLLVTWEITRRCNVRCKYCSIWDDAPEELDTTQIFSIIRELSLLGTQVIHFTGGEPLLRSDFGQILEYCYKKGILTSLNSNGTLVSSRIDELMTLQVLGVSIDGPEEVHDKVRGAGSYKKAMEALAIARDRGIQIRLLTVLSKYNLDAVDFLLDRAMELDASVVFQPATELLLGGEGRNLTAPEVERYHRVIEQIIVKKRGRQARYIANSVSALKFLYDWPDMKMIRCLASLISCRIESDGRVCICFRNQVRGATIGDGRQSVKDAFMKIPLVYCNKCCCASAVELNCLLSLKFDAIFNTWRYLLYRWLFRDGEGQ